MSAVATVISIVLAAVFLMAGVPKILRIAYFRERIRHWRLPLSLLPVIGAVELAGAGLLLVGAASTSRRSAAVGALIGATPPPVVHVACSAGTSSRYDATGRGRRLA